MTPHFKWKSNPLSFDLFPFLWYTFSKSSFLEYVLKKYTMFTVKYNTNPDRQVEYIFKDNPTGLRSLTTFYMGSFPYLDLDIPEIPKFFDIQCPPFHFDDLGELMEAYPEEFV